MRERRRRRGRSSEYELLWRIWSSKKILSLLQTFIHKYTSNDFYRIFFRFTGKFCCLYRKWCCWFCISTKINFWHMCLYTSCQTCRTRFWTRIKNIIFKWESGEFSTEISYSIDFCMGSRIHKFLYAIMISMDDFSRFFIDNHNTKRKTSGINWFLSFLKSLFHIIVMIYTHFLLDN